MLDTSRVRHWCVCAVGTSEALEAPAMEQNIVHAEGTPLSVLLLAIPAHSRWLVQALACRC